jgi:hypothetical protein
MDRSTRGLVDASIAGVEHRTTLFLGRPPGEVARRWMSPRRDPDAGTAPAAELS